MDSWLDYLRQGLSRKRSRDRLAGPEGLSGLKSKLRNLQPFLHRHWRRGALGILLIILTALLSLPQPLLFRYLVDRVLLGKQLVLLAGAILAIAGLGLTEKVARLLEQFYFNRFERELILDIQYDLLERALRFPKSFFDQNETGYLMSRLSSDVQGLRWFFSGTVVYLVSNFFRFLGGIVLLIFLEWRLALGVLVILPVMVIFVRYFSGKIHALGHETMEQQALVSSRFQESLSSVSLIKAFTSEVRTLSRLMSELKKAFQISLEQSTVWSVANLIIDSMPGIARFIVLALGGYWVIKSEWTLGSLLAFQATLGYVFGPAQLLATANLELQNAVASLERVSALFDIVPEENLGVGLKVERLKGEVEFKNVSFSYAGRDPVLKEVSFRADPGDHMAIVGPSGVGKTTLVSLILRFYQPASGEIYYDGRPGSDYELSSLRKRIGYVSQNTLLIAGTIKENLCYGSPEASEEEMLRAAKVAGIHEFIITLPSGYETRIGEKGVNFSEGEKQRLALARALIKEADILVLDEPTSSLDPRTEKPIFELLPALVRDKTLFIVAHRLSTIRDSDRILLLDENHFVAMGTHPSLLESNDTYRSFVSQQQAADRSL